MADLKVELIPMAVISGKVVDAEVFTDQNITSSRWPDDLPAFCAGIVEQFASNS